MPKFTLEIPICLSQRYYILLSFAPDSYHFFVIFEESTVHMELVNSINDALRSRVGDPDAQEEDPEKLEGWN